MKNISSKTKNNVLNLLLNTSVKRILNEKKISKTENPCYMCLKAHLGSNIT
jgi:tRNA(Arg) A34 adenosine deaminase TadA